MGGLCADVGHAAVKAILDAVLAVGSIAALVYIVVLLLYAHPEIGMATLIWMTIQAARQVLAGGP